MKRKTFVPLREQTVIVEPRPVTSDQVDAVMRGSEPLDLRMEKLGSMRHRQKETDGRPLLRYIDDAILRLLQDGDVRQLAA